MAAERAERKVPLGALLSAMRLARGLTQLQLATLAGLSRKMVSRYELGLRPVSPPRFDSLCGVMGYSQEEVDAWEATLLALAAAGVASRPKPKPEPQPPVEPCVPGLDPGLDRAAREAITGLGELLAAEALPIVGRAMLAATLHRQRTRGERLARRLLAAPSRLRPTLLKFSPSYRAWPVVEWLAEASEQAAAREPRLALKTAEMARQTAEACQGPEAERLQGYAWAFVGNARRIANDLRGADEAFALAWKHWRKGEAGDCPQLLEWRLLDLEASLRRNQRRGREALRLLDQASAEAPVEVQLRLALKRALTIAQLGEHLQALKALARAERLMDEKSEPRLRWVLRFNQANSLVALERQSEAVVLLPAIEELALASSNELDLARTLWLRGRIETALGRLGDALAALQRVQSAFSEARLAYDAALSGLDLALVHLELGELGKVRELARAMLWILDDPDFAREGLAALRLFCEAAKRQEATAALARATWVIVERGGGVREAASVATT